MIAGTDHRARPWRGVRTPRGCSGYPLPRGRAAHPHAASLVALGEQQQQLPGPRSRLSPLGPPPELSTEQGRVMPSTSREPGCGGLGAAQPSRGCSRPPPSGGEDGARISEGNKRRGTKERGRTPVAPLGDEPRCFYSLPSVGGTAAANCQQRQVTAQSRPRPGARRGSGGRGRAGGEVPAASPRPGRHRGAGPRRRCPRAVLPGGDRRAPAPPKQLKINK